MSEDTLFHELVSTFHTEAVEHVQALNQALLHLERTPEDDRRISLIQEAFRSAHSLKGAARAVGQERIEHLAHILESVLQQVRDGNIALDPDACDTLYDVLDEIQQYLDAQESGAVSPEAPVAVDDVGETTHAAAVQGTPAQIPSLRAYPTGLGENTIRVPVGKLDDLTAQAGELLIAKISAEQRLVELQTLRQQLRDLPATWREIKAGLARDNGATNGLLAEASTHHEASIQALAQSINDLHQAINQDALRLGTLVARLQDEVRRVRMVPFGTIALALQRGVRDAAHSDGKQVIFDIEGGAVELDQKVLQALKDPLLHLLRNAASHGIEMPDVRKALGKAPEGRVTLAVTLIGSEVHVEVQDDGRGFDLEGLRTASARCGLPALAQGCGGRKCHPP